MATTNSTVARRPLNIEAEVASMRQASVAQLRTKFAEVFGETTNSRHRIWLIRRIAWRLQANAEGGLTKRALERADELARDAEIRVTAPRQPKALTEPAPTPEMWGRDRRLPPPGSWIERPYKGKAIRVLVTADGFEFEGQQYNSLSAIAKKVSGSHVNGFAFFQLGAKP